MVPKFQSQHDTSSLLLWWRGISQRRIQERRRRELGLLRRTLCGPPSLFLSFFTSFFHLHLSFHLFFSLTSKVGSPALFRLHLYYSFLSLASWLGRRCLSFSLTHLSLSIFLSLSLSRVAQIENREHVDRETGPLRGSIAPNIRPSSRAKLGWGKFLPSFLFDNAVHSPFFFLFLFFCCLVVFIVDTSFIV